MYQAKSLGRNTFQFFSSEIQKQVEQRTCLEEDLHRAVKNKEFFLHYQPQVDLATGDLLGLEALIRWQHSNWLDIGPGQFIPVAEECGLLPAIGEWVLYTACQQAATWAGMIEDFNIPISINMSPRQLLSHDFIHTLKKVFLDTGVSAKNIVLELTETAVMKNPDVAIEVLRQIHDMGVEISVDDFGTGYSSLSYLRLFPIDRLKVDYSFVKDIGKDKYADAIVKTILALAHSLDLHVIAEGVETIEQVEFLLKNNCQHVQGFFFSKPIPAKEAELLLLQKQIDWESHTANLFQKIITPPDHGPHLH